MDELKAVLAEIVAKDADTERAVRLAYAVVNFSPPTSHPLLSELIEALDDALAERAIYTAEHWL